MLSLPVIALAFPVGWLVDRIGPKWVMATGFVLYLVTFSGMAFFTFGYWSLFAFMTVFGVAQVVALMPMTAMVFQYTSSSERGVSWPLAVGAHEIEARDAEGRRAKTSVVVK